jgi:hypothetical protein
MHHGALTGVGAEWADGAGVDQLGGVLAGQFHLSIRKIQSFFQEQWQLHFSLGAIANSANSANSANMRIGVTRIGVRSCLVLFERDYFKVTRLGGAEQELTPSRCRPDPFPLRAAQQ